MIGQGLIEGNLLRYLRLPFFFFALLTIVGSAWLYFNRPSAENVFWQAVAANLNSQTLSLQTSVVVETPQDERIQLQTNQYNFQFHPDLVASFLQKNLLEDQDLNRYRSADQVSSRELEYRQADIEDRPQREWYWQESYGSASDVYARHHLETEPPLANWAQRVQLLDYQIDFDQSWHHRQLDNLPVAHFQRFLLTAVANYNGLFIGAFPDNVQRDLMQQLRLVYLVDWESVRPTYHDGRRVYEYEVQLDRVKLGRAFVDYFNATVADNDKVNLTDAEVDRLFTGRSSTYTFVVDAVSQRFIEVRYPLAEQSILAYNHLNVDEFVVTPQVSNLIRQLTAAPGFSVESVTQIAGYNQRLELPVPTPVKLLEVTDN